MNPLPILTVPFNIKARPWELQYFRAAVAESVVSRKPLFAEKGIPTDYFHNHDEQTAADRTITRFPLIQYTLQDDHIVMVGIGDAARALAFYIRVCPDCIRFHERSAPMQVVADKVRIQDYRAHTTPGRNEYYLTRWLGLQEDRYELWKKQERFSDKIQLLEEGLGYTIKRFLNEGASLKMDKPEDIVIRDVFFGDFNTYKGFKLRSFTLIFATHLVLPTNICIGKGCSIGFGQLQAPRRLVQLRPVPAEAMPEQ